MSTTAQHILTEARIPCADMAEYRRAVADYWVEGSQDDARDTMERLEHKYPGIYQVHDEIAEMEGDIDE